MNVGVVEHFGWVGGHNEVDPIVASIYGRAMGVITSLMVVELNNVNQ